MNSSLPKVCHLSSVHERQDTRILHKECVSLSKAGFEVHLVVADGAGDQLHKEVNIVDVGRPRSGRVERMFLTTLKVMKAGLRTHADLFHFHDSELIPTAIILRLLGKRVVYDVHEDVGRSLDNRPWVKPAVKWLFARAIDQLEFLAARVFDFHFIVTPEIARRFPARKRALLRNFPMLDEIRLNDSELPPTPTPFFAYVGTVSSDRGASVMVQAINHPDLKERARLAIGGKIDPDYLIELKNLDRGKLVDFCGFLSRPEVSQLLQQARAGLVLLQPVKAHMDAYPVKLFEYMAAGLPVLASDYPLWRKLLENGRLAKLVDPQNIDDIAKAMIELLQNNDLVEDLARNGSYAAETRYNWQSEERTLIGCYEHILFHNVQ